MTTSEIKTLIAACDTVNKCPLVQGLHGLGKSEIVRQYGKENNLHVETLILSLMDVGDLCGLPRTTEHGGQLSTTWSAPIWFNRIIDAAWPTTLNYEDLEFLDPEFERIVSDLSEATLTRDQLNSWYLEYIGNTSNMLLLHRQDLVSYKKAKRSVLLIDEMNRATTDILNASLQLILDKRLNDHLLPIVNGQDTFVVAAINPDDQDYTVNTFDPALMDRFVFATVEADAQSWLSDYARPHKVNRIVRDFIAEHPDRIHFTPKNGGIGATPRSWTALADFVDKFDTFPIEVHFPVIKGCIGQELGGQFLAYYNQYSKVVKTDDIIALVQKKAKLTKNPETIATHVAKLIKDQEVIQKTELAEQLYDQFIDSKKPNDALPLISYLYALDLEILNTFLSAKKETPKYASLAALDDALNNKNLFRKITTKVK